MIALIIVIIVVAGLAWILFTPIVLNVNTYEDIYSLKMKGILSARLSKGKPAELECRAFFIPFRIPVGWPDSKGEEEGKKKAGEGDKDEAKRREKKKKKGRAFKWPELDDLSVYAKDARQLITSFNVKKLYIQVDTGDVVLNAYLFPLAYLFKNDRVDVNINFDDELGMIFIVENKIWNFTRIGIKFAYRKYVRQLVS